MRSDIRKAQLKQHHQHQSRGETEKRMLITMCLLVWCFNCASLALFHSILLPSFATHTFTHFHYWMNGCNLFLIHFSVFLAFHFSRGNQIEISEQYDYEMASRCWTRAHRLKWATIENFIEKTWHIFPLRCFGELWNKSKTNTRKTNVEMIK